MVSCGTAGSQIIFFFFFQAEDGIRDLIVTGVQTCALPICRNTSTTSIAWSAAADQAIDVVDVFRRSEYVGTIVDEAIGVDPPPRLIWLQVGVVDDAARARAQAAGLPCVMAPCPMADHRGRGA